MGKLTKTQKETLVEIERFGIDGTHFASHYPPIKRLLELGLIADRTARFSGRVYFITPAGRAALKEHSNEV